METAGGSCQRRKLQAAVSGKLSNVAKFMYLRSALSEEPLCFTQSLEITSYNYATAWSLLK